MNVFQTYVQKSVEYVLSAIEYVVAWVNNAYNGVMMKFFALDPQLNAATDQRVNPDGEPETDAEFVSDVKKTFDNKFSQKFFKNNPKFIEEFATKATALANDPDTPLGRPDLLPQTIQVTMHQQVLYCDDSSSMKRQSRWESQNLLINRIGRITTRILPRGEGVYLRYINQDLTNSDSLTFEELGQIIQPLQPRGDTPIGTNLKSKILEPLVYNKLPSNLARPLLVSIITDGLPDPEPLSTLVDAIVECGDRLEKAALPRESVKFLIGQVGNNPKATEFIQSLGRVSSIEQVVFVAAEQLDAAANSRLDKDWDMDEWLITTLFGPIMKSESKKDQ